MKTEMKVENSTFASEGTLQQKLDQYITDEPKLSGAIIGISVRSSVTGEIIYDYMGDTRLHPASNMKLLTGAAALANLGKDYTFATEIYTDGVIENGILKGNLYLKGKGDPTLLQSDFNTFAAKLKALGIQKIAGDLVADDTWYDRIRLSEDLIWSDEQYYYGAQISALTASPNKDYDAGTVIVEVKPGKKAGEKPLVTVTPETDYIEIHNTAKTVATTVSEEELKVGREHGSNKITIEGMISIDSAHYREWIAVWEPTRLATALFKQELEGKGISLVGKVSKGETPAKTAKLITHHSMPLSKLLIPFMKLSNNGHGEILIKEMGKVNDGQGSWDAGLSVLEDELSNFGLNQNTLMLRDGSGISHVNLIPANEISKLLYVIQNEDWFSDYLHALPETGSEERMIGGTLKNRMKDLSVQAKTGTINGVSTLSGYVQTKGNETVIFSIMINNILDEEDGPEIEDAIVNIISNHAE